MNNLIFIDDGYTHEACIAEVSGIHGTLCITYRPMTHEERDQVAQSLVRETSGKSATDVLAQAIASHLSTWNIPLEIKTQNVKKLMPSLFDKLYATICGSRPSDPLPHSGQQPESYREGDDLKN
ncbi:hypothetical protein C5Y96_10790 [Blastopirellula marina]|uniref:Uncharacterized protein n=1 Tax=Blastopirellula marina TaxID=124 RepID=A0A2S8FMX5_9BACT|nr:MULTISPECIES: hypothetical protein [Pirellulaceae]PQO33330.1 hypothetical protein C5Y96_10790 [Blastopirellula marina]RCS52419.1 hypothetical protein DTL36_10800 [Bremerella cremea]